MRLELALSEAPPALEGQRWIGKRALKGAEPGAESVHLVVRDLPAGAVSDPRFTWFGDQTFPGDAPAPDNPGCMLLNMIDIPAEIEAEFNEWYNEEHMARLGALDGVLAVRRFRAIAGAPRYLALYHLADPDVLKRPSWAQAADSPWMRRMQRHRTNQLRIVFTPA